MCLAVFYVLSADQSVGTPSPPERVTVLAGQLDLPRLVDTAAQRLHVNIEYDVAALKGQVNLRLEGGLSDEELWQLVNRAHLNRNAGRPSPS